MFARLGFYMRIYIEIYQCILNMNSLEVDDHICTRFYQKFLCDYFATFLFWEQILILEYVLLSLIDSALYTKNAPFWEQILILEHILLSLIDSELYTKNAMGFFYF